MVATSEQITALPCGFESATFKLDAMNRRDNFGPCCVYTCGNGHPTVKRFNEDGSTSVLTYIDGAFHELQSIQEVEQWAFPF